MRAHTQRLGCDLEYLEEEGDAHRLERACCHQSPGPRNVVGDLLHVRTIAAVAVAAAAVAVAAHE